MDCGLRADHTLTQRIMTKSMTVIQFGDLVLGPINIPDEIVRAYQARAPLSRQHATILQNILEHHVRTIALTAPIQELVAAATRNGLLELSNASIELGIWTCPKCHAAGEAPQGLWNRREARKRRASPAAPATEVECPWCSAKFQADHLLQQPG